MAAKKRGHWAQEKGKYKDNKYGKDPNTMGIGIECLGHISNNGKKIINYVADRLSLLRNESKSIWLNRIRSNLLAVLYNVTKYRLTDLCLFVCLFVCLLFVCLFLVFPFLFVFPLLVICLLRKRK